jgi:hypothetical protein
LVVRNHSDTPTLFHPDSKTDHWKEALAITPHPHHYDHPEKHLEYGTPRSCPSRSTTSMSDHSISRSKTPPSPHHFDHPLTTLTNTTNEPVAKVVLKKKPFKLANMEMKGIKDRLSKILGDKPDKKDVKFELNIEKKSRPNTARSDQRLRWDEDHVGVRNTHWNEVSPNVIQRKADDQTISVGIDKPLLPRKKGDWLHSPLGKIKVDAGSLYMGDLEIFAK